MNQHISSGYLDFGLIAIMQGITKIDLQVLGTHDDNSTWNWSVIAVPNENLYVHCTIKDINNLNVQNENLHVHNTDDIDNLNVQKRSFHVQSINDIDDLDVHWHS